MWRHSSLGMGSAVHFEQMDKDLSLPDNCLAVASGQKSGPSPNHPSRKGSHWGSKKNTLRRVVGMHTSKEMHTAKVAHVKFLESLNGFLNGLPRKVSQVRCVLLVAQPDQKLPISPPCSEDGRLSMWTYLRWRLSTGALLFRRLNTSRPV